MKIPQFGNESGPKLANGQLSFCVERKERFPLYFKLDLEQPGQRMTVG